MSTPAAGAAGPGGSGGFPDEPRRAPLALTARGWGFLVSAAAVGLLWWGVQLQDLRYLMIFPLTALVIAVVCAVVVAPLARAAVTVTGPDTEPEVGDRITLTASVRHRLPVTLSATAVWDVDGRTATGELSLAPRRENLTRPVVTAARRGVLRVGVTFLELRDPLGLVTRRLRCDEADAAVEVLVLPRALDGLPPEIPTDARGAGTSGSTSRRAASGQDAPGGVVRDYRHGDTLRQIHWKQSARQGKLMVNQPEPETAPVSHLVLDTDAAHYPGSGSTDSSGSAGAADVFEQAVSAAVTVADRLQAAGVLVTLTCGERQEVPCPGALDVRRLLAVVAPGSGGVPESLGRHDILVTGPLTAVQQDALRRGGFHGDLLTVGTTAEGDPR